MRRGDLKRAFNEQKGKQRFKIMNQLYAYFLETELQMHSDAVLEMRNSRNIWRAGLLEKWALGKRFLRGARERDGSAGPV